MMEGKKLQVLQCSEHAEEESKRKNDKKNIPRPGIEPGPLALGSDYAAGRKLQRLTPLQCAPLHHLGLCSLGMIKGNWLEVPLATWNVRSIPLWTVVEQVLSFGVCIRWFKSVHLR
jgi:hypothetical protein